MHPLSDYIKKNKNKHPVSVIWGSGLSVNSLSTGAHAPFLNFAANASVMLFPFWKTGSIENRVFMAIDRDAFDWSWFHDGMRSRCCKFLRRYAYSRSKTKRPYFPVNVYKQPETWYFDMRNEDESITDISKLNTVPYASIVPMAIDISLKLGVKFIALAGVEHSAKHGKTHFWQEWNSSKRPIQSGKNGKNRAPKDLTNQKRVWDKNTNVFKQLNLASKRYGTKIVRLTKNSSLSFIPYMKESDFIANAKKLKSF